MSKGEKVPRGVRNRWRDGGFVVEGIVIDVGEVEPGVVYF